MKAAVIINDSAGSVKTENEKIIEESFNEQNTECKIYLVKGKEIETTAKKIIDEGIDILVAAGGDGTVSAVACILAGGKIPLGVLPVGTLNHFAKDLGIPLDLKEAVKVICEGKIKLVDIAEVNGKMFINNSSIGLYTHMVKERETEQKQNLRSKWSAMFIAMISTFKKFPLLYTEIMMNGKLVKLTTSIVFVGNNKYIIELYNAGGREKIDEGVLSLYMTRCKTRFCMIRLAFLSLTSKLSQKDFEINYTTEATINTRKKNIDVSLDGEITKMTPPLVYKIIPKFLTVIVPEIK